MVLSYRIVSHVRVYDSSNIDATDLKNIKNVAESLQLVRGVDA